jgi:Na+/H+ antiporter NhaC
MTWKPTPRTALLSALALLCIAAPLTAEPLLGAQTPAEDAGAASTYGWTSVLPPVIAIVVALVFRNVIPALFLGIWLGAWLLRGFGFEGFFTGLLDVFSVFVHDALADSDHASILLFSLMIGGMVGVILKNGGMQGIVDRIIGWTNTTRRAQLSTAWLGLGIFFDDYANSLVVGNTMRPVTDRLKVSREKLAYLVDSTAAPVACLALVTTWIGYEAGLIGDELLEQGATEGVTGYSLFLASIPYSFYPIFAMAFVLLVAYTGRDFGPMLKAERRARTTGKFLRPGSKVDEAAGEKGTRPIEGKPRRPLNAILPIVTMMATVLIGMYTTGLSAAREAGKEETLQVIIGEASSYSALMWGSLLGAVLAVALSVGQRILTLDQAVDAWYEGVKAMLYAVVILLLAWGLNAVTEGLHTGDYLGELLGESLSPGVLPMCVFLISAAVAFATGTSWGTMAIILPIAFPLTWTVLSNSGVADPTSHAVLLSVVSCVLAGAVWGDHCSPISDTTILSSMVSGCDHVDHVRTQLPYALLVGGVALVAGTIPTAYGFPWWLAIVIGIACLYGLLRLVGQPSDGRPPAEPAA